MNTELRRRRFVIREVGSRKRLLVPGRPTLGFLPAKTRQKGAPATPNLRHVIKASLTIGGLDGRHARKPNPDPVPCRHFRMAFHRRGPGGLLCGSDLRLHVLAQDPPPLDDQRSDRIGTVRSARRSYGNGGYPDDDRLRAFSEVASRGGHIMLKP